MQHYSRIRQSRSSSASFKPIRKQFVQFRLNVDFESIATINLPPDRILNLLVIMVLLTISKYWVVRPKRIYLYAGMADIDRPCTTVVVLTTESR